MVQIKKVALTGATGNVGKHVLPALLANNFTVTVLTRKAASSYPDGVIVKEVDFSSVANLTAAVQGQDAVIDTTQSNDTEAPVNLIEAAVAAGVYRFVPSFFGMDPANKLTHELPVFNRKKVSVELIQEKAASTGITWTIVGNGPFLDWNLQTGFAGIDLPGRRVRFYSGGTNVVDWTTLEQIGIATANILLHPEETLNRAVLISSVRKSTAQIVEMAKEVLGADGWTTEDVDANQALEAAMEGLKAGNYTWAVFGDMIRASMCLPSYSAPWDKDDNALLGVKPLSDAELKQLIKQLEAEGGGSFYDVVWTKA